MPHNPNHPNYLLAYQFDAQTLRYVNVTLAHLNPAESTDTESKYFLDDNATYEPVPHLAPEGKDWYRRGGQAGEWVLVDDNTTKVWYDTNELTGMPVAAPKFGEPVPTHLTNVAPEVRDGFVLDGFDVKAQAWSYRKDLTGKVVYNTTDQSERRLTLEDTDVPAGYTTLKPDSSAFDWDTKAKKWVVNEQRQAELDEATRQAALPQVVTMRQAKLALLQIGLLDDVDAVIANEQTPRSLKIEWEYASEVRREWVGQSGLMQALGMDEVKLDQLFALAASL